MIPLAHIGHLLVDIPLFAGPIAVLAIALMWSTRHERRRQAKGSGGASSA